MAPGPQDQVDWSSHGCQDSEQTDPQHDPHGESGSVLVDLRKSSGPGGQEKGPEWKTQGIGSRNQKSVSNGVK